MSFGFLTTCATLAIGYIVNKSDKRQEERAAEAATQVDEVRKTLDTTASAAGRLSEQAAERAREASLKVDEVRKALLATNASTDALQRERDSQIRATAAKVEEVKQKLDDNAAASSQKLDNLAKVTFSTHLLINSNMEKQLKLNMIVTRRLADLTHDEADITAATAAEEMYAKHLERQRQVDKQEGTDDQKSGRAGANEAKRDEPNPGGPTAAD